MPQPAFHLIQPQKLLSSVVFASPHSCRDYPSEFVEKSQLDKHAIRSSEDAYVDQLFSSAPEFGAPLLLAGVPRAFLDMNRSSDELDPALIEGVRRQGHNPRIASGLGVVPRVVANGRAIYRGKISRDEANDRIKDYWQPYHAALQSVLNNAHAQFGKAILIDCHSMPHEAMESTGRTGTRMPDIVLGDRFGAAAARDVVDQVEASFISAGLNVTRNAPFAGAYVTQAYGRPSRHQHAIQIEIDRSLYMNERTIAKNANFDEIQGLIRAVIGQIVEIGRNELPVAAE